MAALAIAIGLEPPLNPGGKLALVPKKRPPRFAWDRGEMLGLADAQCANCRGMGTRGLRGYPCKCVLRAVFRACWGKYREMEEHELYIGISAVWKETRGRTQGQCWSRPREEFCADVVLTARRSLSGRDWRAFDLHFLQGLEWRPCCVKLGLDRGSFWHLIYRIQQKLGRLWRELKPYGLWPVQEYMYT